MLAYIELVVFIEIGDSFEMSCCKVECLEYRDHGAVIIE